MADLTTVLEREPCVVADFGRPGLRFHVERTQGFGKLLLSGGAAEARFAELVGAPAPAVGQQIEAAGLSYAWLAPAEWLISGAESAVSDQLARLDSCAGDEALLVNLTHARAAFLLAGRDARDALSAHCPLDLRPANFPVGAVARSLLGETGLFLARLQDLADGAHFRILVDQTVAAYAARLLTSF